MPYPRQHGQQLFGGRLPPAGSTPPSRHGLTLNRDTWRAHVNDKLLRLTMAEFLALAELHESQGRVVSRDALCQAALQRQWLGNHDRGVNQLAFHVRLKLQKAGCSLTVRSVRNLGYVLAAAS